MRPDRLAQTRFVGDEEHAFGREFSCLQHDTALCKAYATKSPRIAIGFGLTRGQRAEPASFPGDEI
jgi:hypothetical protein